jgi:hypothetical protein
MSEQKTGRDNKQFQLGQIRVHRINIETEESTTEGESSSWKHIVIKVEDRAGNEFEVERIPVYNYDGMISSSTPNARLVNERSWRDEEGENLTCPICFFPGHGGGACNRLMDTRVPWPKPISHYDSDGPRDGKPAEFNIGGVSFLVTVATGALAPSTGRDRYKVVCRECDEILHEATTGPTNYIESHLKKVHDFHRKLTYAEIQ